MPDVLIYIPPLIVLARAYCDWREGQTGWAVVGALCAGMLIVALIALGLEPPQNPEEPVQGNVLLLLMMAMGFLATSLFALIGGVRAMAAKSYRWAVPLWAVGLGMPMLFYLGTQT